MPDFDSAGVRIHYELKGPDDGDPVLLIHGFASSYRLNWVGSRWQETLVGAGRLVIGMDCRAHGASEKPHDSSAYARGEMAEDAHRLLDHLGVARSDLVGYSMGSWIALHLLLRQGGQIGRAVLGGIGRGRGPGFGAAIARRLRGDESEHDPIAVRFFTFASADPGNDLEALAACIEAPQEPVSDEVLATIRNPVLVVAGDVDDLAVGAPEMAARIPGARLVTLPGRNHMNAVPARQFKEAALEFLAG